MTTIAKLLQTMIDAETDALRRINIPHSTTIGDIYEGFSREMLETALSVDVPLTVTHGFVTDDSDTLSDQMDCLIVRGDKKPLTKYAEAGVYHFDDVIVVLQVKKNLYQADVRDGHNNLATIRRLRPSKIAASESLVRGVFQAMTRVPLPDDVTVLPKYLQIMYHLIKVEATSPVRIVLGYEGFSTESGLRKAFIKYITDLIGEPGMGPSSLPNVFVNKSVTIIKNIGMPWTAPMSDRWWPAMVTSSTVPVGWVLFDAIWTRLFNLGLAGLEDFVGSKNEQWNRLIDFQYDETANGWMVRPWSAKVDLEEADPKEWEPFFIEMPEFVFVNMLCRHPEGVDYLPDEFVGLTQTHLDHLFGLGVIGRDVANDRRYHLLTIRCQCVCLPDGRLAVGEDQGGQMTLWMKSQMDRPSATGSGEVAPKVE
jgi:hypothetical protein